MQDFRRYDYTIRAADLLRVLRDAAAHGYNPTVIINGEFYGVELDAETSLLRLLRLLRISHSKNS